MGHIRESIHIDAPIDHVWEVTADCRRLPEWNVNVFEVNDCPDRLDRVGAKYRTVARVMGRRIEGTSETTKADRPHVFAFKGTTPGGHVTATATFTEVGGGTDAMIEADYELPGGLFAGIAERLLSGSIERDFRHSNENFKALCEATVPGRA